MDSMVFYRSFYEAIKDLKPAEQAKIYDAIFSYALDGTEPNLTGICKSIFVLIKPQIDANNQRKVNGKKGAEHGSKGGRPKNPIGVSEESEDKNPIGVSENEKEKTPQGLDAETPNVNVNVNENVNENVNVNVNENVNANAKNKYKRMYAQDAELNKAVLDFIEHRKKLKKPMTDKAVELFMQRLEKFEKTTAGQITLINTAIERGWQTVYPDKDAVVKKGDDKLRQLEAAAFGRLEEG